MIDLARTSSLVGLVALAALATPGEARAWEPFERKNPAVERGNEALRAGEPERALEAYDEAARSLPGAPGVHLNRGLALLANGDVAGARDALRIASSPETPPELRADALYDLGLSFLDGAEAQATSEAHEEAQRLFREAADAFRGSLRARPGDRETAWNLELALRRLREEQEKQQQKEAEEEAEQAEEPPDDGEKESTPPDAEPQDEEPPPEDGQEGEPQPEQGSPDGEPQQPSEPAGDDADGEPQDAEPPAPEQAPGEPGDEAPPAEPSEAQDEGIPRDVARVLDALREDEQSLERARASTRARRERREPAKDW